MSSSDWSKRDSLGTGLFGIAAFVLLVTACVFIILGQWSKLHEAYSEYQKNSAYDRRNASEKAAQACKDRDVSTVSLCVADKLEAYYQKQSANQDLQAQQDMAFWAYWLFVVSFVATVISGMGIFLLWKTLLTARDTFVAARRQADIAEAAYSDIERPYVYVRPNSGDIAISDNTRIELTNFGKTPAVLNTIAGYLIVAVQCPFANSVTPGIPVGPNPVLADPKDGRTYTLNCIGTPVQHSEYWLCGVVTYRDMKGQNYWCEFCYQFDFKTMRFARQADSMNRSGKDQYPGPA